MIRKSWGIERLTACQIMSIAMTTVLPEPVAILKARRLMPSFQRWLVCSSRPKIPRQACSCAIWPASQR